jgi:hypothetical protein
MITSKFARGIVFGLLLYLVAPALAGTWYTGCGDRYTEQLWLNRAVRHLKVLRLRCTDPDLQGVLDYTIHRYNRIGAWDVMVLPLSCPEPGCKVLGINCPWCPGVTLDPEVLSYPIHEGALILVHEALHDYWPYFGHAHVDPRIEKLEALSWQVR